MSGNIKQEYSDIKDIKDVDKALKVIAEIKRFIKSAEIERDARLQVVNEQCDLKIGDKRQILAELESRVNAFCVDQKKTIFKEKNTVNLVFGGIVLKKCPPKLVLARGTWQDVVGAIEAIGTPDVMNCIKIKAEPDKNQIKKLSKEMHEKIGVNVVSDEKIIIKTN